MVYQCVRKNVKIAILVCTNMRNGYFIITEVGAMKKRIKHLSKSTVSVILTLCMLVSCVTVGLIATDAAQLTGENRVGAAASEDSEVAASVGDDSQVGTGNVIPAGTYFLKYNSFYFYQKKQINLRQ